MMTPSRRDDLQSMFYVIIALMNGDKLPWSIEAEMRGMMQDKNFESKFLSLRLDHHDRYNDEIRMKLPF